MEDVMEVRYPVFLLRLRYNQMLMQFLLEIKRCIARTKDTAIYELKAEWVPELIQSSQVKDVFKQIIANTLGEEDINIIDIFVFKLLRAVMGFTPVSSRSGHVDMGWIVSPTKELQDCSKRGRTSSWKLGFSGVAKSAPLPVRQTHAITHGACIRRLWAIISWQGRSAQPSD